MRWFGFRQFPPCSRGLLAAVFLMACAPDAWRPDRGYETFLDQVQQRCGYEHIGSRVIGSDLLQDAYFLDVTARFYHRQIGSENYADAVSGSFGGAADSAGIRCILGVTPDRLPRSGGSGITD